jgi:hypothetical protein
MWPQGWKRLKKEIRFLIVTAAGMKMTSGILRCVVSWKLIALVVEAVAPLKHRSICTRLHGATSQKTVIKVENLWFKVLRDERQVSGI